jgi:replicative DNA helicase
MIATLHADQRSTVRDLVRFWKGPLGFDIGTDPESMLRFMVEVGAKTLIGDSLKDLAVDLVKDEAGTRVNRAWQLLIAAGIEVVDLHHPRKAIAGESRKPRSLDDVYGSTWLTAGHGSVLLLWGNPGDPIVELGHLKQPHEEVGPLRVLIDHELGEVEVHEGGDVLAILRGASSPMAARDVARVLFSSDKPTDAEIEKARRRCERLVGKGLAVANRQGRDDRGRAQPVLYGAAAR